jgi:hypothetical protein
MNRHEPGTKDTLQTRARKGENLGGRWVALLPTQGWGELCGGASWAAQGGVR